MQVVTKANKPELNIEATWSIFKCMFALLIFTNLLWGGFCAYLLHKTSTDTTTTTEMWQDGTNNNQSITNG